MADAADSKSADSNIVWVQVPPPAPQNTVRIIVLLRYFIMRTREYYRDYVQADKESSVRSRLLRKIIVQDQSVRIRDMARLDMQHKFLLFGYVN